MGNNIIIMSKDIRDNLELDFYVLIYGMGIIVMVVLILFRVFFFYEGMIKLGF